jgi:hypothetical protein
MAIKSNLQLLRKKVIDLKQLSDKMNLIINEVDRYFDKFTADAKTDANNEIGVLLSDIEASMTDMQTVYNATEELASDLQPPLTVPDLVGLQESVASSTLTATGFTNINTVVRSSDQPANEVVRQDPSPNTKYARSQVVTIFVSSGIV